MASNFEETSISRNAKRNYSPIADIDTFTAAVQKFIDDTSMGLTKKEAGAKTYKAKIEYADIDSNDKGYLLYYGNDKDPYEAMATFLEDTTAAETAGGSGGFAVRDALNDAWSAKFSCALGEDTFNITFTRDYALINGFATDSTLTAIETWADTVEEFGGDAI